MRIETISAREALSVMRPLFKGTKTIPFDMAIQPEGGRCLFTGYSPSMQVAIPVTCDDAVPMTISGKKLSDIVTTITSEDLSLTEGQIRAGRSRFTMPTGKIEDFPFFKTEGSESSVIFAAKLSTLERVGIAAGESLTQPAMNGVCFSSQGGKLFMVATDTHRLHADIIKGISIRDGNWIIPSAAIPFLSRIVSGGEDIEVTLTGRWASFRSGNGSTFYTSLIDANYPDWRKIVPKDVSTWFTCNSQELMDVFRQVSLIVAKDNRVNINPMVDSVRVEAINQETGESFTAEIPAKVENQTGPRSFNAAYLAEAIAGYASESVTMHIVGNNNRPAIMVKNHEGAAILAGIRD